MIRNKLFMTFTKTQVTNTITNTNIRSKHAYKLNRE